MAKIITAIAILTCTSTSCQQSKTDDKEGRPEETQEIQFPNIYEITVREKNGQQRFRFHITRNYGISQTPKQLLISIIS